MTSILNCILALPIGNWIDIIIPLWSIWIFLGGIIAIIGSCVGLWCYSKYKPEEFDFKFVGDGDVPFVTLCGMFIIGLVEGIAGMVAIFLISEVNMLPIIGLLVCLVSMFMLDFLLKHACIRGILGFIGLGLLGALIYLSFISNGIGV